MKIHNIKQGSPEWFCIKQLKMSASHSQTIATQGKGLETYINELIADYLSNAEKIHYSNEHIERGNQLEPEARKIYELEKDCFVYEVGFVELGEYWGVSPDGMVNEDGLLEIKCPSDRVYIEQLLSSKIPSAYLWQMQMQMLIPNRVWCDYMVYNPNFKKDYLITRVFTNEEMQDKIKTGLKKGEQMIIDKLKKLKELKLNKEI